MHNPNVTQPELEQTPGQITFYEIEIFQTTEYQNFICMAYKKRTKVKVKSHSLRPDIYTIFNKTVATY